MTLYSRAVIPTNSLYLIHKVCGERMNNVITYLDALSTTTLKSDVVKPHKFIRKYDSISKKCYVRYNYDTCLEPIDLDEIIETMASEGIYDCWIHKINLRIKHDLGLFDFVFRNKKLTAGSEAERWIVNYMEKMIDMGFVKRPKYGHLPLMTALTIPRGGNLDTDEFGNPAFISWLSRKTEGLVKLKVVEKTSEDKFLDVRIREPI